MTKDPRVYIAHILERIQRIERFTAEGRTRFFKDEMIQDGVLRNLEVIGEAVKRVDYAYRDTHPEIPWRTIAGLRDVLIHQYEAVDLERVWGAVEKDLPGLRDLLVKLVPSLDQLEQELAGEDEPQDK
jgi:uncharacterized protein with HEPN domain